MGQAQTIIGGGVKIYINERIFGIATSLTWNSNGNRRPIHGLDQVIPFELAPSISDISGTIACMRIRLDGGLEGRGIAADDANIAAEKYISIMAVDRLSDTVIFRVDQAAVDNQSWSISSRGIVTGTFTFQGITWTNDSQN